MTPRQRINHITRWIGQYARKSRAQSLVVGISGGIDSSVVSTLCARTGIPTLAVIMPIHQSSHTQHLSVEHGLWLTQNFSNVEVITANLTGVFDQLQELLQAAAGTVDREHQDLSWANTRSRLRMLTLYQIAQSRRGLVVGTGNRVEDFGVGFFTKYGDGGVDISPIGDCVKTDVWAMGRDLGVLPDIISAAPTDGLWADGRTDEDQLGMSYEQLEIAMLLDQTGAPAQGAQQKKNLKRYRDIRKRNLHKMEPIPVCRFDK
jgi:NAD+ synthase